MRGSGRRGQLQVGDQGAEPAAAALVCDEHVVQAEGAEAGDVCGMAMGPGAHQGLFVEVVGSLDRGCFVTSDIKKIGEDLVDEPDEFVGAAVGLCPYPARCFTRGIAAADGFFIRKEVCDDALCPFEEVGGEKMARVRQDLQLPEQRINCGRIAGDGLPPHAGDGFPRNVRGNGPSDLLFDEVLHYYYLL